MCLNLLGLMFWFIELLSFRILRWIFVIFMFVIFNLLRLIKKNIHKNRKVFRIRKICSFCLFYLFDCAVFSSVFRLKIYILKVGFTKIKCCCIKKYFFKPLVQYFYTVFDILYAFIRKFFYVLLYNIKKCDISYT